MNLAASPELFYLVLTAALTGLIWPSYIVNRIIEMGLWAALRNPAPDGPPAAPWAARAMKAHRNALENLTVFAPLALSVHVLDVSSEATALAAAVFFWSRVGHLGVYLLGIPVARTLLFAVGFASQAVLFLALVGS